MLHSNKYFVFLWYKMRLYTIYLCNVITVCSANKLIYIVFYTSYMEVADKHFTYSNTMGKETHADKHFLIYIYACCVSLYFIICRAADWLIVTLYWSSTVLSGICYLVSHHMYSGSKIISVLWVLNVSICKEIHCTSHHFEQ